jgi:hypothetical protein
MADFVAVLRKTIGGLGDTTPAMRDKVFDKARSTIEAKLAAIQPPPPAAAVERQRKALEDAIAVVRAEFDAPAAPEAPEANDTLDDIFAEFDRPSPPAPLLPSSAAVAAPPRVPEPAPEPEPEPAAAIPAAPQAAAPAASGHDELHAPVAERLAGDRPAQRRATPDGAQRRPRRGLLAAALALVALLALGVAICGGVDSSARLALPRGLPWPSLRPKTRRSRPRPPPRILPPRLPTTRPVRKRPPGRRRPSPSLRRKWRPAARRNSPSACCPTAARWTKGRAAASRG